MLCTFTTKDGAVIIRSDDIRLIEDGPEDTAELIWLLGDEITSRTVIGTATDNRDRIQQEELDLIARVEAHRYETQRRLNEGYPVPQVKRGKQ